MNEPVAASGAWLPAKAVAAAATATIHAIDETRSRNMTAAVSRVMERGRWSWRTFSRVPLSFREAKRLLPEATRIIIMMHMEGQHRTAERLRDFAGRAVSLLPDATMFVSIDDFCAIRNHYGPVS